ncbi:MAG: tRNA (adenine-N1)-methyltransferase [Acidimicrobiia bacterium]|nr:tRNA (adenine-N1)-methyltransferase [Acidimicrobiia bacterium]
MGDDCLLIDAKGKYYLIRLTEGGNFHSHLGRLPHVDIIGIQEGSSVVSEKGSRLVVLRPRFFDYILKMKRGAQVVYPKDIGPILVYADIAPGSLVLEAGTGSGALTMALVRGVGPDGRVVSVERRSDHAEHAHQAIERYFGTIPSNLELRVGNVEEMVAGVQPDRIVLDLPQPWDIVEAAVDSLQGGGVFCSYVPTVPQMQQTVETLQASGAFIELMSFETFLRTWNVEGRSVRPDHRMVGHTGFITVARKILPA